MKHKVVVGASYGDEGKGLVTNYLSRLNSDYRTFNVLCNGGPQRGHTVHVEDYSHVFHHFGSGLTIGAKTVFADDFMVNPMEFVKEWDQIGTDFPQIDMNSVDVYYQNPILTLPHDMVYNQMTEKENKHGSCGYGIWATQLRCSPVGTQYPHMKPIEDECITRIRDLHGRSDEWIKGYLFERVLEYYLDKIEDEGYDQKFADKFEKVIMNEGMREHWLQDYRFMYSKTELFEDVGEMGSDLFVYEMGQGLELSSKAVENYPHISGSDTGITQALRFANSIGGNFDRDVEIYYVTRSYLTRHGNGPIDFPMTKKEIEDSYKMEIIDETNVPNEWQGEIRYGKIGVDRMRRSIDRDLELWEPLKVNVVVTHMNETKGYVMTNRGDMSPAAFVGSLGNYTPWVSFNPKSFSNCVGV